MTVEVGVARTVSHHLLRRRARARANELDRREATATDGPPTVNYMVERAQRGPWRWRVVAVRILHT